jgi:hypothetical protein
VRWALAAFLDSVLVGSLAFGALQLAYHSTPCSDVSNCFPLAPAVVACVLLSIVLYYLVSVRILKATPGQLIFRVETDS